MAKKNILAAILTLIILFVIPNLIGLCFKNYGILDAWLIGIGVIVGAGSIITIGVLIYLFIIKCLNDKPQNNAN